MKRGILMDQKHLITIIVDGGNVQSVHTTLPAVCDIEVEMLDFDNARVNDDPDALEDAREKLAAAEREQRQIY